MRRVVKEDPSGSVAVTEQTVTTKTVGSPAQVPFPGIQLPPSKRSGKEDINVWFSRLTTAERSNDYNYYLYRMDRNVVITQEDSDLREPVKYLHKFKSEDLAELANGTFMDELVDFIKTRFGGGKYSLKVVQKKMATMMYAKVLDIEGEPILTPREGFAPGTMPPGSGLDQSVLPMLMKLIDDKLAAIRGGNETPAMAMQQFAQAVMQTNSEALKFALANQPKTSSPEEQLINMGKMFELFKSLQPVPQPLATPPAPKTMVEQLQEFSMMMEALDKLKAQRQPAENPQSIASAVVEGLAKSGIGRSKPGVDYTPLLLKLGEIAIPVLAPIGAALAEKIKASRTVGEVQPRIPGVRVIPGQAHAVHTPAGVAATGGPLPSGGPANGAAHPGQAHGVHVQSAAANTPAAPAAASAQPTQQAQPAERELTSDDVATVHQWTISTRLVDMLQHDRSGEDAAASIADMFPDAAVRMRFATIDILKGIVASDPILVQVKEDPRLPAFLQSFYGFFHPPEDSAEADTISAKVN